jgi:hypothetical protein
METEEAAKSGQKLADLVMARWQACDRSLAEERRDFWLNYAFYTGHQWIGWDKRRNVVVNFSQMAGDDASRVRITINIVRERVNQLIGRFTQRNLTFEGQPTAADDATINGARLGESILEDQRNEQGWEGVREEEVFNTLMGGTSAVALEWDSSAKANLWTDAQTNDVKGEGNVKLVPLSIAEFSLQPGSRRVPDAFWWVGCTAVPPKQAKSFYELSWLPKPDASASYSPLQRTLLTERGVDSTTDLTAVYVYYERPNKACPEGRKAVVINGKLVREGKWDFPFTDRLNIEVFHQQRLPMRWTGSTIMKDARGIQVSYNQAWSSIIEAAKLAGNILLMVPKGSFDDDSSITDEQGEIVEYEPWDNGHKPYYLAPPELPRWLTSMPDQLEAKMDGVLHTHAVSRGEAPGDRNSGLALSILAEKNDTPLGPMARGQANGWGRIGSLVLEMYAKKATAKRVSVVRSEDGVPHRMEWNGERLRGQTTVIVPLDSALPQSKVATQALLANMAAQFPALQASLTSDVLLRVMDMPGTKLLTQVADANVAFAQRENYLMAAGEPREPRPWDDHAKHFSEHNRYRNSASYDAMDETGKQIFELHMQAHQRLIEEEALKQAKLNAINPGFAGLPQANAPIGSAVPLDQQAAAAAALQGVPAA